MGAQRVVVAGFGAAGLRTAESLRANGYAGEIVAVSAERWAPYDRPPLSKEALSAGLEHQTLALRVRRDADVTSIAGTEVTAVSLDRCTVDLSDGATVGYDALVVSTGLAPRRLPLAGPPPEPSAGRHVLRTLEDAAALRAALLSARRVVIVGAGFIGCEVAAVAVRLGCRVDCVALEEQPMLRPLGRTLAAELRRRHESAGVRFHLGVAVTELLGDEHVSGVRLSDGTVLHTDVVLEALGGRCNVDWLTGNGLDLVDGVRTDSALRAVRNGAPVDGVVAVGDIARFPNARFHDREIRVEHWSVPTETGRRAGAVLAAHLGDRAGDEVACEPWAPVPSFWSSQYGFRMQSYGMPDLADPDGAVLLEGDLQGECVMGYFSDRDLVGVVGLGMLRETNGFRQRVGRALPA